MRLPVKVPDVKNVLHPDASDRHALHGDQPTKIVNLKIHIVTVNYNYKESMSRSMGGMERRMF